VRAIATDPVTAFELLHTPHFLMATGAKYVCLDFNGRFQWEQKALTDGGISHLKKFPNFHQTYRPFLLSVESNNTVCILDVKAGIISKFF